MENSDTLYIIKHNTETGYIVRLQTLIELIMVQY